MLAWVCGRGVSLLLAWVCGRCGWGGSLVTVAAVTTVPAAVLEPGPVPEVAVAVQNVEHTGKAKYGTPSLHYLVNTLHKMNALYRKLVQMCA